MSTNALRNSKVVRCREKAAPGVALILAMMCIPAVSMAQTPTQSGSAPQMIRAVGTKSVSDKTASSDTAQPAKSAGDPTALTYSERAEL